MNAGLFGCFSEDMGLPPARMPRRQVVGRNPHDHR
jgi:hypothetical protein